MYPKSIIPVGTSLISSRISIIIFYIFLSNLAQSHQSVISNLSLNLTCYHDSDCFSQIDDSHCNIYRTCECNYGTYPKYVDANHLIRENRTLPKRINRDDNELVLACVMYKCFSSNDCSEFYESPSECEKGLCRCSPGYKSSLDRCWPIFKKLDGKCKERKECGPLATCGPDGHCECTFGSIRENDIACTNMPLCHSDEQCRALVPYSVCQLQLW